MQKDALPVIESSPLEKRLFLPAGHGGEQNISMKMKRFLIKKLQRIMNVNALSNPEKIKKCVDFPFQTTFSVLHG